MKQIYDNIFGDIYQVTLIRLQTILLTFSFYLVPFKFTRLLLGLRYDTQEWIVRSNISYLDLLHNRNMLAADGHIHNGGESVTIWKTGRSACISQHLYERTLEYFSPTMMDESPGPMVSISDTIQGEYLATTNVGDNWYVTDCDSNVHPIDQMASCPMDAMGIARVSGTKGRFTDSI
jgi:hypothetical protein